jgi:hypothetical protein
MTAALQQETEVFCEKQISAEMTEGRQRGGWEWEPREAVAARERGFCKRPYTQSFYSILIEKSLNYLH